MSSQAPQSFIEWRGEWTLAVGFMDEGHRRLAALINRLARDHGPLAPPGEPGPDPLSLHESLDELAREARRHFQREEESMRNANYPHFDDHKSDHDLLLAELSVLTRELHDSHSRYLDAADLDTLKDWLLGHVLDFDRRLADFIKDPNRPEPIPVSSD
jgi:hemerythrin